MSDFDSTDRDNRGYTGGNQGARGMGAGNNNEFSDFDQNNSGSGMGGGRDFGNNNNMSDMSGRGTNVGGAGQNYNDGFNGDSNFSSDVNSANLSGGGNGTSQGLGGYQSGGQQQGGFDDHPSQLEGGTTRHGAAHHGHEGGFDDSNNRNMGTGVAGGYGDDNGLGRTTVGERERGGYGDDNNTGSGMGGGMGGGNYGTSDNYDSGNTGTYGSGQNDAGFDGSNQQQNTKPSMGEKLKGTADQMIGKMTKNPTKAEEGRQLKSGENYNDNYNNA